MQNGTTKTEVLSGAAITYSGGSDACNDGSGRDRTFTVKVYCNWNLTASETAYNPLMSSNDTCQPEVFIVSPIGCNVFDRSIIWEYLEIAAPYLGFVAIGFGTFLTFLGLKLVRPSIFIVGLLGGTVTGVILFYSIYSDKIELTNAFWYFLGGGVGVGLIVGMLLACFARIGAAIAGGIGGGLLGMFIY